MRNLFALSLLTVAAPVFAQPPVSPQVHADGRVTFRLRAPNAQEVVVRCEGTKPLPMQKDERGGWSATTDPLEPDIYAYSFAVDGLRVLDPDTGASRLLLAGNTRGMLPGGGGRYLLLLLDAFAVQPPRSRLQYPQAFIPPPYLIGAARWI